MALGETETATAWANYAPLDPAELVDGRPPIRFNPNNGRYTWPLMRPHLGRRPPFSPRGHTGAPWLGKTGTDTRVDGLCPTDEAAGLIDRNQRYYPLTVVNVPIQYSANRVDLDGQIYVLSEDKDAVIAGGPDNPLRTPLAIRSNVGDCTTIILTSETKDKVSNKFNSKVNLHTHFVQFDPQASDGVITGLSFEQSVRPYPTEGRQLVEAVSAGADTLVVSHTDRLHVGTYVGVGLGEGMCNLGVRASRGRVGSEHDRRTRRLCARLRRRLFWTPHTG